MYMFLLLWCFLAVAIIADIFMAAIETITSKEVAETMEVRKEVGSTDMVEREFTVKVTALHRSMTVILLPITLKFGRSGTILSPTSL